jgi:DNA-directed RNA polymerase specialized sigma24 family protein
MGPTLGYGEGDAWATLYRRHHGAVVRHVEQETGDAALAHDIAQNVFLAALLRLQRGRRPSRSDLFRWADRLVDISRHEPMVPVDDPALLQVDEVVELPSSDLAALAVAVERLPPREREALGLVYEEGWPFEAVCYVLDIDEHGLGRVLRAGRWRLRAEFLRLRDGLPVVASVAAAARRRARLVARRLIGAVDEGPASWQALVERLPPVLPWVMTSTAAVSLAVLVTVSGGTARLPQPGPPLTRAATSVSEHADRGQGAPSPPGQAGLRRAHEPAVAVQVSPVISRARHDRTDQHRVQPVEAALPPARATENQDGTIGPTLGFDCPPPAERPLVVAQACPLLEALSPGA